MPIVQKSSVTSTSSPDVREYGLGVNTVRLRGPFGGLAGATFTHSRSFGGSHGGLRTYPSG